MFTNLRELITSMPNEADCREYVAKQRWKNGKAICPYCGCGRCYNIEGGKRYKCSDKACYKKFSVTVGTIMEASNIPLTKWLTGIYLITAHKKGISSYQLGRDLGIAQKNAWFMLHRIREMLKVKGKSKLDNIVEIDEVYIGGKVSNMSKSKRKKLRDNGDSYNTKTMVMGMIERGGNLKLIPIGSSNNLTAIHPVIKENVDKDAVVITDSLATYKGLKNDFAGHEVVNHTENEYVRDKVIHTNSIEGAFSLLKRSIIGIYHQVTPKHLDRYCDETMFRYNLRKMTDASRFTHSLTNMEGRLTWNALVGAKPLIKVMPEKKSYYNKVEVHSGKKQVLQILEGEVIGKYDSISEAAKANNTSYTNIQMALKRGNKAVGFNWDYA